jgi:hypothetical protein
MIKNVEVIISVDAEFTINHAFSNPEEFLPSSETLFSPLPNEDIGFKAFLNLLNKHNVKVTFFTEALNAHFFGAEEMKQHVRQMLKFNHDVQLHAHPVWQEFKDPQWKKNIVNKQLKDHFLDIPANEIAETLDECIEVFTEWTGTKPIAFRAGNLQASLPLYEALGQKEFVFSSNIGIPIFKPKEELLLVENKSVALHNVIEIPVTTFQSMGVRHKALTITGTSSKETKGILRQCKEKGIQRVVILTHIHEFIKKNSNLSKIKSNQVNLDRLDSLCSFVNNEDGFEFNTFGNLRGREKELLAEDNEPQIINTSVLAGLWTVFQNKINDKIWAY